MEYPIPDVRAAAEEAAAAVGGSAGRGTGVSLCHCVSVSVCVVHHLRLPPLSLAWVSQRGRGAASERENQERANTRGVTKSPLLMYEGHFIVEKRVPQQV